MNLPIRRRALLAGAAAVTTAAAVGTAGTASAAVPSGRGSVSGAPQLPAGFNSTFHSRFVNANGIRLHAVVGGRGRPLLLIHGWPETWYAWRLIMPALARDFQVVAVDLRGMGLSDKPRDGYDTATLAADLAGLMTELGHQRFSVAGHDIGMPTAYALAADHPDRVDRLAVAEAPLPGVAPSFPFFVPGALNDKIWHIAFNRTKQVAEQLVRGREDIFFGYEFETQATRKLPDYAVDYYISLLAASHSALSGSFGFYRAIDATIAQNQQRATRKLTLPVLAIGGANSAGTAVADSMRYGAVNVQGLVIPGTGHWVAEEAPQELLTALTTFLAA